MYPLVTSTTYIFSTSSRSTGCHKFRQITISQRLKYTRGTGRDKRELLLSIFHPSHQLFCATFSKTNDDKEHVDLNGSTILFSHFFSLQYGFINFYYYFFISIRCNISIVNTFPQRHERQKGLNFIPEGVFETFDEPQPSQQKPETKMAIISTLYCLLRICASDFNSKLNNTSTGFRAYTTLINDTFFPYTFDSSLKQIYILLKILNYVHLPKKKVFFIRCFFFTSQMV